MPGAVNGSGLQLRVFDDTSMAQPQSAAECGRHDNTTATRSTKRYGEITDDGHADQ